MANQTKVTNGDQPAGDDNAPSGVFRFAQEAIELGELQARLLMLDMQNSSANARAAVFYTVVAVVVVLCAAQVTLLWVAAALVAWAGWSWTAGLGAAAGVGLLLAALLIRVAWVHCQRGIGTWERSRSEFSKNMVWLKSSLAGKGRTASDRQ